MILARGENKGGKEILLMGLSRENINRLTKGEPIALRREPSTKTRRSRSTRGYD
jgi:hypothetical protein